MASHDRVARRYSGKERRAGVRRCMSPVSHVPAASLGLLAVRLLGWAEEAGRGGLIYIASSERRADRLARVLRGIVPDLEVLVFPPWDCLPYDRSLPSRDAMGRRMSTLRRVCQDARARVVLTVPDALVQRVPPRDAVAHAGLTLQVGDALDVQELRAELERLGYVADARVDEAGEFTLLGQVVDVFPPGAESPLRIKHADGKIQALCYYRAEDQLTFDEVERVQLDPASEIVVCQSAERFDREPGIEHRFPEFYPSVETLFDYLPAAIIRIERAAERRRIEALEQITDAYARRLGLMERRRGAASRAPLPPEALFVREQEWAALVADRRVLTLRERGDGDDRAAVPLLAAEDNPTHAFGSLLERTISGGGRILISAPNDRDLRAMLRRAERATGQAPHVVGDWVSVQAYAPGSVLGLRADLDRGFIDEESGTVVVTSADLLGSRAQLEPEVGRQNPAGLGRDDLHFGDTVVHLDYGLGVLAALEVTPTAQSAEVEEAVRLTYRDATSVLVPVTDLDRIWRYGGDADTIALDRLHGEAWPKRRQEILDEIAAAARALVDEAHRREHVNIRKLAWPAREYERLARRFPFAETPDQSHAIEDVLSDLASERPMNRLVCGDVGYGKTEIALRAAGAAALAGKQVAVVAPTTVLVRQHLETFRRRFAGSGIAIGHLSRLVKASEARGVKQALAEGTLRILVGTDALAAKGVRFRELGLVVLDEEQRFGTAQKAKIEALAKGLHVLSLTATPIPRTFQRALVGLVDISLLQTPPVRRRPIRTFVLPFDPVTVREALLREQRRGGQSFVVCPRIEDIDRLARQLAELVPEAEVLTAHGKMPVEELDSTTVRFADGQGDVLLATNIIENGLDIPRANTIIIWRADRFGLAQLHQLRGRVGRGRARGIAYLVTDPEQKVTAASRKRLETIQAHDRLGAGFEISRRDLDIRGAGDLLGDRQAGHVKLLGAELNQHLLSRALRVARGEALENDEPPRMNIGVVGSIPEAFVSDAEARLNLYARLAKLPGGQSVEAFADELEDRFGPLPRPVQHLLQLARAKNLCRAIGITRVDAGPKGIALSCGEGELSTQLCKQHRGLALTNRRVLLRSHGDAEPLTFILDLLEGLGRHRIERI
jgi:transcription-repair coupling factor (superfamily II helicase)